MSEASLFFGHFSKYVTFQLSKDLKRGRGTLLHFLHLTLVWEIEPFLHFVLLYCNINLHIVLTVMTIHIL